MNLGITCRLGLASCIFYRPLRTYDEYPATINQKIKFQLRQANKKEKE